MNREIVVDVNLVDLGHEAVCILLVSIVAAIELTNT